MMNGEGLATCAFEADRFSASSNNAAMECAFMTVVNDCRREIESAIMPFEQVPYCEATHRPAGDTQRRMLA